MRRRDALAGAGAAAALLPAALLAAAPAASVPSGDPEMEALWISFVAARDAVDADNGREATEEELGRFFESEYAIIYAEPVTAAGVAVQLRFLAWHIEESEPGDWGDTILAHAIKTLSARAAS